MMNTPVSDFVEKYNNDGFVRLHVPGHKGVGGSCEKADITEIQGADVLYHETGILSESQKNAASLFGTAKTVYSAEGSSLCIRAMLTLVKMYAAASGKSPLIYAARNAHKVFMTASALLDIGVKWIYPDEFSSVVSCVITKEELYDIFSRCEKLPAALYITSPDYLGNISDIKGLSEVCREFGVLLVVDNAHGAYLKFLDSDIHPISLGADMCCDSAHKTFSVLTGGAYLHISENAPDIIKANAQRAMALFASTSPSYLILSSLDRMNKTLSDGYTVKLNDFSLKISRLKEALITQGFELIGNEPLKVTVSCKSYGFTGEGIADILRKNKIECEFADPDFCVMMFTPEITDDELEKVLSAFSEIERKAEISEKAPIIKKGEEVFSVREALFMPSEAVKTEDAAGRILASPSVSCPPAIPVAVCGERLSDEAVECFRYYGIENIDVIKE